MARTKNPQETLSAILEVSSRLFREKGYDQTSIQDILGELGISKGAVYHHFKSKEEILDAVMERHFRESTAAFRSALEQDAVGSIKEKLTLAFVQIANDEEKNGFGATAKSQTKDPRFLVTGLKSTVQRSAPIIAEYMAEVDDESFAAKHPTEAAEVLMLLLNIWVNPFLFERGREATVRRMRFLQHLFKSLGMDVVSDDLIDGLDRVFSSAGGYEQNKR